MMILSIEVALHEVLVFTWMNGVDESVAVYGFSLYDMELREISLQTRWITKMRGDIDRLQYHACVQSEA